MAGPKAKTPAPIDRPLARAYLREFSGWSTAYPPGLSDPTSLREMENVQVNRDGSLRIRPGLRCLAYEPDPDEVMDPGFPMSIKPVGTHEAFYLNEGGKAYLFAVRELNNTVGFRVLKFDTGVGLVAPLSDVFQVGADLNFSTATTYVKYLQIDNKIFALSDAGETMRLFNVGAAKSAKRLSSIEVPAWTVEDKLQVIQPDAAWTPGVLLSTRTNRLTNPTFETNVAAWTPDNASATAHSATLAHSGDRSMRVTSQPTRTNLMVNPLTTAGADAAWGWSAGAAMDSIGNRPAGAAGVRGVTVPTALSAYLNSPAYSVVPGRSYKFTFTAHALERVDNFYILYRWYNSSGAQIGTDAQVSVGTSLGVRAASLGTAPTGAVTGRVFPRITRSSFMPVPFAMSLQISSANLCRTEEPGAIFTGSSGANYFWLGTPNKSASVYHPPQTVQVESNRSPVAALGRLTASAYWRAGTTARNMYIGFRWYNSAGALMPSVGGGSVGPDSTSVWTRGSATSGAAPAGAVTGSAVLGLENVPRGEYHYIDDALLEQGSTLADYFSGATVGSPTEINGWTGTPHASTSTKKTYAAATTLPTPETKTVDTLISTGTNDFNFGFFYAFSNELGESAMSQITSIRASRAWGQWRWELPNAAGEPGGTATPDPELAADQLVAILPEAVWNEARAQGATSWTLYMLTWSNQDSVPVEGVKLATVELTAASTYTSQGWARMTPQQAAGAGAALPQAANRYNYSNPSRGGQGLVAADRMILVKDPTQAAVIKWTSNEQGDYTNFSASRGGGYKTLTSGNLFIPACVKLWQNPQSADTLTILCMGTDGHSTGYYMAPAQVVSQSDTVNVMGFEETTATPGTSSPYGVEVFNNALYHPLDEQLMKSTASNYNINHKSLTDQIENRWSEITHKEMIVSSQLDGRMYYIVNNPGGEPLIEGNMGNEVWVFDAASENGMWSRWLVPGHSLRKIALGGIVYMSIVRHDGIFYFDPAYDRDDVSVDDAIVTRFIPWRFETNTQGANRAHDAWARVRQLEIGLGNFEGTIEWGLRSWDQYGQVVEKNKIFRQLDTTFADDGMPWDLDDQLLIDRDLRQWFFYARSVTDADGEVLHSAGQINAVQYRYTPISVNVGYDYGSVETFEYGRAAANWDQRTTDAGVPTPFNDQRRP